MLWVLKRTVSMRRFFWAPKTYVKTDGLEKNIYIFTLKIFVYLNLWTLIETLNIDLEGKATLKVSDYKIQVFNNNAKLNQNWM